MEDNRESQQHRLRNRKKSNSAKQAWKKHHYNYMRGIRQRERDNMKTSRDIKGESMDIKKLNEELDRILNEDELDDILNDSEIKRIENGEESSFNPLAKQYLEKLKKDTIEYIKYNKERGFNKEKNLEDIHYACTDMIYDAIPLSKRTKFGDYARDEEMLSKIFNNKDLEWLKNKELELEKSFPNEDIDIIYNCAMNKCINYFNNNIENWYNEI